MGFFFSCIFLRALRKPLLWASIREKLHDLIDEKYYKETVWRNKDGVLVGSKDGNWGIKKAQKKGKQD